MNRWGLIFAAFALAMPSTLVAQVMAPSVADEDVVTLDPAKSYVLIRAPAPLALMLIREPDAADRAAWQARRDEAFAEAVRRYPRQLQIYQRRRETWLNGGRRGRVPEAPVEPTQYNFQFPPIETEMMFGIGPLFRFAKDGESVYLSELRPGTYHIYGPVSALPGIPPTGYCLCLGSVQFEVTEGGITDLGRIVSIPDMHSRLFDAQARPQMDPDNAVTPFTIEPATVNARLDPRLVGARVTPAFYRAGRQFPNYFGLIVDRINPMRGVIAYRRDVIVDVRAEQAATPESAMQPEPAAAALDPDVATPPS